MKEHYWIDVDEPMPDDSATHAFEQLDPRPVTRVEGESIWLDFWGDEFGPFPKANYTYRRLIGS